MHDPNNPSVNKPLNKVSHFSPKVGFRSTLFDGFDFKANVSIVYSLPNGAIRYDRDADVDPSEVWQYEAGIEYNYKSLLNMNLTGFILNTSKEVSETAPGSGLFVNSGKTQRRGLELGLRAQPVKRLNLDGSLAFVKTEIKVNEDKSIEANELNSVPRSVANVSLDYTFESGFGARVNLRAVGKYATGLKNFFYYKGYTRADAKLFYNFAGVYSYKGQFFIEVNNIFNENYSNYVIDNGGPGDGQSYSASPMRSFSIGVSCNF